jgi:polygalacturonase
MSSMGLPALSFTNIAFANRLVKEENPWAHAQSIVDKLRKPLQFKNQTLNILNFGAAPCELRDLQGEIAHHEYGLISTPEKDSFDCRQSIIKAINECHVRGGGKVIIPKGNWYCAGSIILKSNVHLHLESGARVLFSNSPQDYAKHGDFDCGENGKLSLTRWQGNDCLNFTSMIYAYGQHNIALTGEDWSSILDGQGGTPFDHDDGNWWTWKAGSSPSQSDKRLMNAASVNSSNESTFNRLAGGLSEKTRSAIAGSDNKWLGDEYFLPSLSEAKVRKELRVFGLGHYLRPCLINLVNCTNVHLSGYQLTNSPFWQHHPINCKNLYIHDVYCNSLGPNSDGFDPESCDHVLVEKCTFDTGDDCIAIKSGKNLDTALGPSQNIVIQNCTMQSGHGGVTLGSEMSGGIKNIYVQDILMENKNWKTNPLNTAIRLKTNMNRGGYLKNFYVRRVVLPNGVQTKPEFYKSLPNSPIDSKTIPTAAGSIVTFDCDYSPTKDNIRSRPPVIENIHISEVRASNVVTANGLFSCYQPIVILGPVRESFNGQTLASSFHAVERVYISDCDFGDCVNVKEPIFLHNVKSLSLKNVRVNGVLMNTILKKGA